MPKLMSNHGNYIVSMGNVCRWMAAQAEALGGPPIANSRTPGELLPPEFRTETDGRF
jgi:flavin-dependent dehydrogenase